MTERRPRWAKLLPDHRTLYLSLEELDADREPGESDAQMLMRSLRFVQRLNERDQADLHQHARDVLDRAGLSEKDPLGLELALALVVRARYIAEHPKVVYVLAGNDEESGENSEFDSSS